VKELWERALANRARESKAAEDETRRAQANIYRIGGMPSGVYCVGCAKVGAIFKDSEGRPLCRICHRERLRNIDAQHQLSAKRPRGDLRAHLAEVAGAKGQR
jgi:hypothetical protein